MFFSESCLSLPGVLIAESAYVGLDLYQMSPLSLDVTMETTPTAPDVTYTVADDVEMEDLSTPSPPERPSVLEEDTLTDTTIAMDIPGVGAVPVVTYELIDGATHSGNTLRVSSNM